MDINKICRQQQDYAVNLRREFHMHPELGNDEKWTSARIKEELSKLSIAYEDVEGTCGVIGWIEGDKKGKTLSIRADIDGLPVYEETNLPFKSQTEGLMHACGHDGHIALLLGTAKVLSENRNLISGTVYFVFQSAEEQGAGALEVIAALDKKGGVDEMIGLHIWSKYEAGTIVIHDGPAMAGVGEVKITVKGRGGHASRPDLCIDPIKPACRMVLDISSIPSNFYDVLDHSVVHVGTIQSGTAPNIFPETAEFRLGYRFYKPEGLENIFSLIKQICDGIGKSYGVTVEYDRAHSVVPIINHSGPVKEARRIALEIEDLHLDLSKEPLSASDNFALYMQKYSGFYAFLGAMNKDKGIIWDHHNPKFDFDEDVMAKGIEFFCRYVLEFFSE